MLQDPQRAPSDTPACPDEVVERNRSLLLKRSLVGINKYNTTLASSGLSILQLKRHLLEELLDAANYLQAEIMELERQLDDGK